MIKALNQTFDKLKNSEKAKCLQRFFKTGPGEYGEGDLFLGITMPQLRALAKKQLNLSHESLTPFLTSPYHEKRMFAFLVLLYQYQKADEKTQKKVYQFYIKHLDYVNNWDLVDVTVPHVVGAYLYTRDCNVLFVWARSKNLWRRRIAILATFYFIRQGEFSLTLELAENFLTDTHDLMHKAVGWMLREIGKRNEKTLLAFLNQHYPNMPRTMLRYAIERLPEKLRLAYLHGTI